MGKRTDEYVMLVVKSVGISSLEGSMCLYGNNIRTNLVEMVLGNVDRITYVCIQNSDQCLVFVNKVMSLSVP